MTGLRLLAAAGTAAVVAASGGALLAPRRPAAPEAVAPVEPVPPLAAIPAVARVREPRRSVQPGVLARAAGARALERAPICTPVPEHPPQACAPPRDSVEIEWDVAPER